MIIMIDTSTPVCRLTLIDEQKTSNLEWQADRQLAKGLLGFLRDSLADRGKSFGDIVAIGVMQGPGSFTGLRIGLTVMNTLADSLEVPIVAAKGDNWQQTVLDRLDNLENDHVVVPHYGAEANITKPRK